MNRDDEMEQSSSREESRLSTELYLVIMQTCSKKGSIKVADVRKMYNKTVTRDKSISFREFPILLKQIERRFWFYLRWKLTISDDKLFLVNQLPLPPIDNETSDEMQIINGILNAALIYIYMSKNIHSKNQDVHSDDLFQFLGTICAGNSEYKILDVEMDNLKKLVAPNNKALFIKKGWISYRKVLNINEEEEIRYDLGPTARSCVDPSAIVELYQMFTNDTEIKIIERIKRAVKDKSDILHIVKIGTLKPSRD